MTSDILLEEKQIKVANLKLAKGLLPFIKPYLWMFCLSTILIFIVIFLELLMPVFIQKALDGFIVPVGQKKGTMLFGISIDSFQIFCLFILLFILITFVIDFFQVLFMEYTGQKIILNLRHTLFSHMTFLPVSFYDENSSGRLVSRVAGDIENMNEMFTSVLIFIFKDLVLMAGVIVVLFTIDTKLASYLVCLIPVIIISIVLFSKISRNAFRTIRQKIAEINHNFSEAVTGLKIIQTTSSKNRFVQRFKNLNFEHYTAALFQIKIFSIFMPFIGFLSVLSIGIIIHTGSLQVINKSLSLGELVAFLTYMKLFFRPLRELSEKFNMLQNALASAERIVNVLDKTTEKQRSKCKQNYIDKIVSIEFDKVNFSYNKNAAILKNIRFKLQKGECLGFVGRTGSGKTSIVNLITGFYRPDNGNIMINNINHNSINIKDIRNKIALVMQDPFLFSGSIKENITPPDQDMKTSDLEKALYDANCDFLFEKFNGIDTIIQEGGSPLSSGEKQLVCIARAFAFNPDLIIFDEATSYMDSGSEKKVHDAVKKLLKGRLSIIIAHRLSIVKDCNNIILLRDGNIRDQGSHNELVKKKGEYYHLLKSDLLSC